MRKKPLNFKRILVLSLTFDLMNNYWMIINYFNDSKILVNTLRRFSIKF